MRPSLPGWRTGSRAVGAGKGDRRYFLAPARVLVPPLALLATMWPRRSARAAKFDRRVKASHDGRHSFVIVVAHCIAMHDDDLASVPRALAFEPAPAFQISNALSEPFFGPPRRLAIRAARSIRSQASAHLARQADASQHHNISTICVHRRRRRAPRPPLICGWSITSQLGRGHGFVVFSGLKSLKLRD
jgi:hypothetical protein